MVTGDDIEAFAGNGFARIPGAVPREIAGRCHAEPWEATGPRSRRPFDPDGAGRPARRPPRWSGRC